MGTEYHSLEMVLPAADYQKRVHNFLAQPPPCRDTIDSSYCFDANINSELAHANTSFTALKYIREP